MLAKLAFQNLKEKKLRTFLASFAVAIGTASMIIFLGLSEGIQNATFTEIENKTPLTQITVRAKAEKSSIISFIARSEEGKLNESTVKEIEKIPGVKEIYRELQFNNFSSLEASVLGINFVTDTMVFGLPKNFIKNDLKKPDIWEKTTEPYPAIIPKKLLDLYNLTIASSQNLPNLTEESLIGKQLTLFPNYSTLFPVAGNKTDQVKFEVAGFSDKVNLIGISIPDSLVKSLNEKYTGNTKQTYLELFIEAKDASKTIEIAKKIEALGYQTEYFQKNLKDIEAKFTYLKISLGAISLVILLTAAIAIISTFLGSINERTKEIGLLTALGATKSHIKKIILLEAGAIGLIGSTMGIILGLISSKIIDLIGLNRLAKSTFTLNSLFSISPELIIFTLIFGTLLSILAAYLPAHKASNIRPIEALQRS